MQCPKCNKATGIMLLVVGILFLLADKGIWNFWGVKWYTALFIIAGVVILASSSCLDCHNCCQPQMPTEKTKKK